MISSSAKVGCLDLDVSELEAPEPLVLATRALHQLPKGQYLHLTHRMAPCRLYDFMLEHHFGNRTCKGSDGMCELFIWHLDDHHSAAIIEELSKDMPEWPR